MGIYILSLDSVGDYFNNPATITYFPCYITTKKLPYRKIAVQQFLLYQTRV